jgi:DNA-binding protein WhiA
MATPRNEFRGITSAVRSELIDVEDSVTCRSAQLAAMLRLSAELRVRRGLRMTVSVELAATARYIRREIGELYGVVAVATVQEHGTYVVEVGDRTAELARAVGLLNSVGGETAGLPVRVVGGTPSEVAAALRGAFIVAGRLYSAGNRPALEISAPTPEAASALRSCAARIGVSALTAERRGVDVMVVNDRRSVELLLTRMGAGRSLDEFARMRMRDQMTTMGNLVTANVRRTAAAAVTTCEQVERAISILGDDAPANLLEAGRLRLRYRDASLAELGRYASPELSKDAVSGQLRRLLQMADKRAAGADSNKVLAGSAA